MAKKNKSAKSEATSDDGVQSLLEQILAKLNAVEETLNGLITEDPDPKDQVEEQAEEEPETEKKSKDKKSKDKKSKDKKSKDKKSKKPKGDDGAERKDLEDVELADLQEVSAKLLEAGERSRFKEILEENKTRSLNNAAKKRWGDIYTALCDAVDELG